MAQAGPAQAAQEGLAEQVHRQASMERRLLAAVAVEQTATLQVLAVLVAAALQVPQERQTPAAVAVVQQVRQERAVPVL